MVLTIKLQSDLDTEDTKKHDNAILDKTMKHDLLIDL